MTQPISRDKPRAPRKLHGCVVAIVVLLVLFLLLLMAGPAILRMLISRKLPAAELQRLEVFKTKPVHFPREWQTVQQVPEEVLEQGKRVKGLAESPNLTDLLGDSSVVRALETVRKGRTLPDDQWTTLSLLAREYVTIHEELQQLVRMRGYSFQSFLNPSGQDNFIPMFIRKAASAAAQVQDRSGHTSGALSILLPVLRMTDDRGEPLSSFGERTLGMVNGPLLLDIASVVSDSTDTLLVKSLLSELNGRTRSFEDRSLEVRLSAPYLAELRQFKANGLKISLQPGLTGRSYCNQANDLWLPHALKELEKSPFNSPDRSVLLQNIEIAKSHRGPLPAFLYDYIYDTYGSDILFLMAWQSYDDYEKFRLKALAIFDVLRLDLAARILQLEGKPVTPDAALSLLPGKQKPLIDPYSATGRPYQFHPDPPHFFSVGENGMSDHRTSSTKFSADHIGDDVIGLRPLEVTTYALH